MRYPGIHVLIERRMVLDKDLVRRRARVSELALAIAGSRTGLSLRERRVLYMRGYLVKTLKECGEEFGVTRQAAEVTQKNALSKLERALPGIREEWNYATNFRKSAYRFFKVVREDGIHARETIINLALNSTVLKDSEAEVIRRRMFGDSTYWLGKEYGKAQSTVYNFYSKALAKLMQEYRLSRQTLRAAGIWADPIRTRKRILKYASEHYYTRRRNVANANGSM